MRILLDLFLVFARIGAFTFGGGYAMLPLIQREVTDVRQWATDEEIVDIFAIAQTLPGIIAINTAIYIGYKTKGFAGAVAATLGVILPSFVIIMSLVWVLVAIKDSLTVKKAFLGVRAGVTAMIGLSAWKLSRAVLKTGFSVAVCVLSFTAIAVLGIPTLHVLLTALLIGFLMEPARRLLAKSRWKGNRS
jgi:chromate transporter